MNSKEFLNNIVLNGSPEEKRELYRFGFETPRKIIANKFKYFARGNYPRYFKQKSAKFHDDFIEDMIRSYFRDNMLEAAFRGSAKTSLKKLFDVFVLLNDDSAFRKYIKVLSKDGKNSKQIVTDVYNLMVEVQDIYGNQFEKEGDIKHEETMGGFTMKNGRKYTAGTVGETQRGHIQDAYRPDWIWFEDIEDRTTIKSLVVTQSIIDRCDEAIQGLSIDGSYFVSCNYISDQGTIQWFMNKASVKTRITPLLRDPDDNTSATWPEAYPPEKVQKIKDDADDFFGEFQCDPKRSQNKFFDTTRIEDDMKRCRPPKKISAGVKYWLEYQPHHRYGQGSDHSEGIGEDSNALGGWDFTSGELAYSYANNKIAPDLAAHEFARVGAEYGNCLWGPEVNAKCGGIVITTIKQINYPQVYRYIDDTKVGKKQTEKMGWETNGKTKRTMFFEFRKDYNDGLIKIYDMELLKEMKAYGNNDLNETKAGLITRHFDLLTAAVIGWQMRKHSNIAANTMTSYEKRMNEYLNS